MILKTATLGLAAIPEATTSTRARKNDFAVGHRQEIHGKDR